MLMSIFALFALDEQRGPAANARFRAHQGYRHPVGVSTQSEELEGKQAPLHNHICLLLFVSCADGPSHYPLHVWCPHWRHWVQRDLFRGIRTLDQFVKLV